MTKGMAIAVFRYLLFSCYLSQAPTKTIKTKPATSKGRHWSGIPRINPAKPEITEAIVVKGVLIPFHEKGDTYDF